MPFTSLQKVHVAKLLTDNSTEVTYDTPKLLADAIEASITVNENTSSFYAENQIKAEDKVLQSIELSLNLDSLSNEIKQYIFGLTVDANGVTQQSGNANNKYYAIGFEADKSGGTGDKRMVWLYKGTLTEGGSTFTSKTDSTTFQGSSITGRFIQRNFDSLVKGDIDTDDATANQIVLDQWFDRVYDENHTYL